MLLLPFVTRPIKIVNVATACTSGFNLYTSAGSPTYPLNLYCFISNTVNSSSSSTPALRTGSALSNGTWVYIKNSNTITGAPGSSGAGGAGGSATTGTGNPGNPGGPGGTGGTSVLVEGNQFKNFLDNGTGTITRGNGGTGGGGGGGAGGSQTVTPKGGSPVTYSGGGGGGGAGSPVGPGGSPGGSPGTATTGGAGQPGIQTVSFGVPGASGGPGGNLGQAGSAGSNYENAGPGGPGGPAGPTGPIGTSISGSNKITYVSNGTITGPVVN